MTVIKPLFHNGMVLHNMNYINQLHHNDEVWHHQIGILVEVVNDTAPYYGAILIRCLYDIMSMIDNRRQTIEGGVSDEGVTFFSF